MYTLATIPMYFYEQSFCLNHINTDAVTVDYPQIWVQ
jgi:hypothetical protein